ncbi:uncharacterized protein PAC_09501 [Phialocephala subalpina]|uniref:Uncharacterized protein n=1 Tax=Phialocephala subalpina TaxID=576137 RepID=A0A1L7X3P0_9HELO|nr:uncharacterized protein PAC_09501 [Phialocephala subalpina]
MAEYSRMDVFAFAEFFAFPNGVPPPDHVLDVGNIHPNIMIRMADLQPKPENACKTNKELSLDADEAMAIAYLWQGIKVSSGDSPRFAMLKSKAEKAVLDRKSMALSPDEAQCFHIRIGRNGSVRSSGVKPPNIVNLWAEYFLRYKTDGTHPLDFKMDRSRDYTLELAGNKEEFALKTQHMSCSEPEQYAECQFFCDVTCMEKLESIRKGGKAVFNSKEAARVLSLVTRYMARNPTFKGGSDLPEAHPRNQGGAKLMAITMGCTGSGTLLAMDEAAALLETCLHVPRPKTLRDKAVIFVQEQLDAARKSLEAKECELVNVRTELEHSKTEHVGEVKKLNRKIAAKERALVEKDKVSTLAGESNHRRQELKSEVTRAKSDADNLRQELKKARKEPDKVKEQWSGKIQELHDKVAAKNAELVVEKQAHQYLQLDNKATLEDLRLYREQTASLQAKLEAQKTSAKNVESIIKKNEGLQKSLAVAKTNQRIETDRINGAVSKATAPLTEKINQLEQLRSCGILMLRKSRDCLAPTSLRQPRLLFRRKASLRVKKFRICSGSAREGAG